MKDRRTVSVDHQTIDGCDMWKKNFNKTYGFEYNRQSL